MKIKKVAVLGKGAVGLLYATLMARNLGPENVVFVMDDARFERHKADSITVNGEPCTIRTIPASEAEPVDFVMLAIKGPGLPEALDSMEHLVGEHTLIASLLNGIRSEQVIAERFGWKNLVLSVAQGMDAVFFGGAMKYTHEGEVCLGPAEGTREGAVEDIAELCMRGGIPHTVEKDIRHRMWTKLMLNDGLNQTCMVYGARYEEVLGETEANRSFISAMREVMAVAHAEGVGLTEDDLREMVRLTETLDPDSMPSMAQDNLNHKLTEVDEFAGTIIALAEKHDILVPQNRFLYKRIREIEASWSR